jgi:hypothetical protein
MVRRATRTSEQGRPASLPRRPALPPANDNLAPGIVVALAIVAGVLVVLAALSWLLLA